MISETQLSSLVPAFPAIGSLSPDLFSQLAMELAPQDSIVAAESMQVKGQAGTLVATQHKLLAVYHTKMLKRFVTYQEIFYLHVRVIRQQGNEVYVYASAELSTRPANADAMFEENTFAFATADMAARFAAYMHGCAPHLHSEPAAPIEQPVANATPPQTMARAPYDVASVIEQHVARHEGRKVHLRRSLPPKKAQAVSRILGGVTAEEALAVFDLTLFGGCDDAVVLTTSGLIAKDMDDKTVLAYANIQAISDAGALGDRIQAQTTMGTVSFSCGDHAEILVPLLRQLVG